MAITSTTVTLAPVGPTHRVAITLAGGTIRAGLATVGQDAITRATLAGAAAPATATIGVAVSTTGGIMGMVSIGGGRRGWSLSGCRVGLMVNRANLSNRLAITSSFEEHARKRTGLELLH